MSEFQETPQPAEHKIDLKGGRCYGPFQYHGEPVDIMMADQRF